MSELIKCRRCGKCCTWQLPGMPAPETCRYLVKVGKEKYACRIYKQPIRMGLILGYWNEVPIICKPRTAVLKFYEGCPYNDVVSKKYNIAQEEPVTQSINSKLSK